eukprot:3757967-Prymnesium_polylepis.1
MASSSVASVCVAMVAVAGPAGDLSTIGDERCAPSSSELSTSELSAAAARAQTGVNRGAGGGRDGIPYRPRISGQRTRVDWSFRGASQ